MERALNDYLTAIGSLPVGSAISSYPLHLHSDSPKPVLFGDQFLQASIESTGRQAGEAKPISQK